MTIANPCPQTILFLAANPKDTYQLRLGQELRDIEDGLNRAQKRDQFNLVQRFAVRPRDIQRAMLDLNPQIIHFSGHGIGEEGLMFEDDMGNAKLVNGEALADLCALFADKLQCVLLSGCYSEVQAKAIAQHVPYVIGMKKAIGDKAAISFAVGFYDALGAGRNVEFAFKLGCAAIRLEGLTDHAVPTLISNKDWVKSTIRYELVLSGSFATFDQSNVDTIVAHLRDITHDPTLTLIELVEGSIKLILEGSQDGFDRLNHLIQTGKLTEVLDIPIYNLERIESVVQDSQSAIATRTQKTALSNPKDKLQPTPNSNLKDSRKDDRLQPELFQNEANADSQVASHTPSSPKISESSLGRSGSLFHRIKDRKYWALSGAVALLATIGVYFSLPLLTTRLFTQPGIAQLKAGNRNAAEAKLKWAIRLNPNDAQAHFQLAKLYEERQQRRKARSHYQEAIRGGILPAKNNLARLHILANDNGPAVNLLLQILDSTSDNPLPPEAEHSVLKNLGWARLQQENYEAAAEHLQTAIALEDERVFPPESIADTHCLMAQVLEGQGAEVGARSFWQTCNENANITIPEQDKWAAMAQKRLSPPDEEPWPKYVQ